MATLDYVDVPSAATRLQPSSRRSGSDSLTSPNSIRPAPRVLTALPHPSRNPTTQLGGLHSRSRSQSPSVTNFSAALASPTKTAFNILPQLLLATSLPSTAPPSSQTRTSGHANAKPTLLTTRDPLSIQITTVNFRHFVAKVGPIFWLQDRLEEILFWKRGWKVTSLWMAVYAFLCYFPRMILLLPQITIISIILATSPANTHDPTQGPPSNISEGSVDWQANIQAIQNLMGAVSDLHDFLLPLLPHLTHKSPYTSPLLTLTLLSTLLTIPILASSILPIQDICLFLGLTPFILTHPRILPLLPLLPHLALEGPSGKKRITQAVRMVDDDRLSDVCWNAEMREVELWENERWDITASKGDDTDEFAEGDGKVGMGWSKANLRPGERCAWTRGRDGWSGVREDGSGDVSSNLTFSLAPDWKFVESEDWRADIEATWISDIGSDSNGWVYTNDTWLDPHPYPLDSWKSSGSGMTRRRRWIRRVYYCPDVPPKSNGA